MHTNINTYEWAVIGAGPAGIATVGKLIDSGVPSEKIVWLDPEFKVGDFGTKWLNVSSNTRVGLFLKYLHSSNAFEYSDCSKDFILNSLPPEDTCKLHLAAEPLQWVTTILQKKVNCIMAKVKKINLYNRQWEIATNEEIITHAKNVVLAIGAEPKKLIHSEIEVIPLESAMDEEQLKQCCTEDDTIAVFGASHSAIIILRALIEAGIVKNVINFYLSPLRYAVYLDDWILFDDTGLKGTTAVWAREFIDGKQPEKLKRVLATHEHVSQYLPQCNKAIYAVGFQKRSLPIIEGFDQLHYNPHNGIIAPGLFGTGIAFPEANIDRFGTLEYRVGLWKFMDYITRMLPIWKQYVV
jgi:hypothetical protein